MATEDQVSSPPAVQQDTEPQTTTATSKKRKSALTEIEVDLSLPEPPSKKARRLLKKGKPLPVKPRSDDEDNADSDADAAKDKDGKDKPKKERSEHGVWIGNLPFTTTRDELRKWLIDNSGGAITEEAITRVHMPMVTSKPQKMVGGRKDDAAKKTATTQNKGFAYVDFATFEAGVAAAALSEQGMGGRKLLIKNSKNFEGRPAKKKEDYDDADNDEAAEKGNQKEGKAGKLKRGQGTKIFVGNLAFNTNEDELWAHFSKCGAIRWVKVATFEDTGKCKGYGWVNFEEAEAADWAVKGFVKIKETIETVEDFMDEGKTRPASEEEGPQNGENQTTAAAAGEGEKSQIVRKFKTRKWWVNQLQGRTLKIERAEDDQFRYNKRFGKDAPGRKTGEDGQENGRAGKRERRPRSGDGDGEGRPQRSAPRDHDAGETKTEWPSKDKPKKAFGFHDDINVARLTGAAVAPQGVKTSFD